jgi:segregation and condensation protein B
MEHNPPTEGKTAGLATKAEAMLFAEGSALSLKKLSQLLECSAEELHAALDELATSLEARGIALIRTETEAALAVAPQAHAAVESAYERELGHDVGSAGLEVLAILLYRGASTRSQVDYIRGVNSSSTIRTLLSRGLLERTGNPDDAREYLYRPTVELLAHLGLREARELPDYAKIVDELAAFEKTQHISEDPFESHDRDTADNAD